MIVTIGYLAAMQRLLVPALPVPPAEGAMGILATPFITADAPLVGLGLSARGIHCVGVYNDPGRSALSLAARRLVEQCVKSVIWGGYSGELFELQILAENGEILWFADGNNGLRSLLELDWLSLPEEASLIYLDLYPWIEKLMYQALPAGLKGVFFFNCGDSEREWLMSTIRRWRTRLDNPIIVQASSKDEILSDSDAVELARSLVQQGIKCAIVTRAQHGVVVAIEGRYVARPALPVVDFKDATGAGAAVSTAIVALLHQRPDSVSAEELVEVALTAGAAQCGHSGPLDTVSRGKWEELLADRRSLSSS